MPRRDPKPAFTAPLDDEPMPPPLRRRGIKLFVAGTVLVVLIARVWWGQFADRRLQAAAAEWRAIDAALPPHDLSEPAVPDEDNAAFYLRRAAAQLGGLSKEGYGQFTLPDNLPSPPIDARKFGDWLETNPPLLADVRRARRANFVAWGVRPLSPGEDLGQWYERSTLSDQWYVANTASNAAAHAHAAGDDASAVEWLRDILAIGRAVERQPALPSQTGAGALDHIALQRLASIGPALNVDADGKGVAPHAVREFMAELLATDSSRSHLFRAVRAEQCDPAHLRGEVPAGWAAKQTKKWNGYENEYESPAWLDRAVGRGSWPYAAIEQARRVRGDMTLLNAVAAASYPAATAKLPRGSNPVPTTGLFGVDWVTKSFGPDRWGELLLAHYNRIMERRVAAVALAVRLYQADHGGRLPATLAELVPAYLPALPTDPMAADGRPVGYMPTAPVPFIYSVGADGIDDTVAGRTVVPAFLNQPDFAWALVLPKPGATPAGPSPTPARPRGR